MSSRRPERRDPADPWRDAPVGELHDPLLPRWFVLGVLGIIPLAVAVFLAAFLVSDGDPQPVAERRPPPAGGLTNDVGEYAVGELPPVAYAASCPELHGVQLAGTEQDIETLESGLAPLCNFPLDEATADRLRRFAAAGGVVRFAVFEATGVDSTAELGAGAPRILINGKFTRVRTPRWIAPLIAHDVTFLDLDAATAEGALAARRAEHAVCQQVLRGQRLSRGCEDAAALLALADPLAALRTAGFE